MANTDSPNMAIVSNLCPNFSLYLYDNYISYGLSNSFARLHLITSHIKEIPLAILLLCLETITTNSPF